MPPNEHSEYSPSGMGAKLKCLGMHLATKGMYRESGPAADRGTECHEWAEKLILKPTTPVPDFKEDWQEDCTRDMVGHASQIIEDLSLMDDDVLVRVEQKVNLGWIGDEEFDLSQVYGTCDVLIYSQVARTLVVLDYKTGVGVHVNPERNVQLMIYALGALGDYQSLGVDKISIVVSQPRVYEEPQVWNTTPYELLDWATTELLEGLTTMSQPGAPFTPGEDQCKWCPLNGQCVAQKTEMLDMLESHPKPAAAGDAMLTDQEINDLGLRLKEFNAWVSAVQGVLQGRLEKGIDLPDFKLVHGRGSRNWADLEAADKFLAGQKLKEKERYTFKLLSPAQAEKVLKENLKKTITLNRFNALVDKQEGKITWALKSDKRPAVNMNPMDELVNLEDLL